MDISFFARGLAIGFAIAAPVGAIGLLCIRRTLPMAAWSGSSPGWERRPPTPSTAPSRHLV